MDLVTGPLGSLISKLGELLKEEYNLHKGLKEQVKSLSLELQSAHAALRTVAQVPPDQLDPQVELWAREVREASYDMEDILDTFLVRVDGGPWPADPDRVKRLLMKMGKLFNLSKVKARHEIARAIEGINKKVQEMAERRARYRVDDLVGKPAAVTSVDPRLSFLYTKSSQLVGIDEPRDVIIEMLSLGEDNASNKEMTIVSVVGFGGLGKTTLAKAVYDKVNPRFDCRAFVPVGRYPDPRKVLRDILIDLINNEAQDISVDLDKKRYTGGVDLVVLDERQLINKLRNFLDKKRYFIVIDDIWDISIWEMITNAFVDNGHGSRIIATSRNSQVSAEIGGQVYRIKELSDSNSRKLFYTRIFGGEGDKRPDNHELDEISDNIIRKCDGVPLAVIAVASLLVTKPMKDWCNVYNSIGFGHGDNRQVKNMMKILSFSYYDLPCHLRTCLLYLSVFIDDYLFEKNELIWRWIAEGLIPEEKGKGLFEVGDSYFHELINRSMILPVEEKHEGLVLFCRVHDMVLHLIRDLSSKENFAAVLDREQLSLAQVNARRLAFQNLIGEQSHQQVNDMGVQKVRSFNAILCAANMIPRVSSFQVLRVLALIYCRGMKSYHLENIGKLHHLRYLGLSHTPIRELPAEVGHLKFLQTLLLEDTGIQELPVSMRCLTQLMCLRADKKTRAPDWIGELASLVELEIYPGADGTCFVKELGKLSDLMVLKTMITVQDEGQGRGLLESLSNLQKIQIMDIGTGNAFYEDVVMQPSFVLPFNLRVLHLDSLVFSRLPAWIDSSLLPNLCCLVVQLIEVDEQDLEILGRFPELRALSLFTTDKYIITKPVIGDGGGFQNLRFFLMNFQLQFQQGAMPRLQVIHLVISVYRVKEDNLGLDIGLGNLSSLEEVAVLIHCALARPTEADEVESAVRHTVDIHPNRPTLKAVRTKEDEMIMGAADSRMLTRQRFRREGVIAQLNFWTHLYEAFCSEANEVSQMIHEGHPSFAEMAQLYQQLRKTDESAKHELSLRSGFGVDPDLNLVIEDTGALERAVKIYRVKYPRLVAMLEELKAELNQQTEEAESAVRHAVDIPPDCSTLQGIRWRESEMVRLRIKEQRVMLRYRAQTKLLAALRSEVNETTQLIPDGHPVYAKRKQLVDHSNDTVGRANHELSLWSEDSDDEEDRGLHQVIEDTLALERAVKIYTVEYPILVAMLEELKAELNKEEVGVKHPVYVQTELFEPLRSNAREMIESIPDGHPITVKINQFVDQFNDTMERVSHEFSVLHSGLGDEEAPERAYGMYAAGYLRLSAILGDLKAELKLQPEDDGLDKISEHVPEELGEEPTLFSNLSID